MKKTVKLLGLIAIVTVIGFAMAACDGSSSPAGSGTGSGVNRATLNAAISEAEFLVAATLLSADGSGIFATLYWAAQAAHDTFNTAIATAIDVRDDNSAALTQAQVNAARDALLAATTTFNAARSPGVVLNPAALDAAIAAAIVLRDAPTVEAADGFALQAGIWWATAVARTTFANAITAAEAVYASPTNQAQINLAVEDLLAAHNAFNTARSLSESGDIRINGGTELILRGRVYYQGTNNALDAPRTVTARTSEGELLSGAGTINADGYLHFRISAPTLGALQRFEDLIADVWGDMPGITFNTNAPNAQAAMVGNSDDNEGLRIFPDDNDLLREDMQGTQGLDLLYLRQAASFYSAGGTMSGLELKPFNLQLSAGWNLLRFYQIEENVWTVSLDSGEANSFTNQNLRWHKN